MSFTGKRLVSAAPTGGLIGEEVINFGMGQTGTWTVPDGVYSISVLTVDAGSDGGDGDGGTESEPGSGGIGGLVGETTYVNNLPVVPGQQIPWRVGIQSATPSIRLSCWGSTTSRHPDAVFITPPGVTSAESGGAGSSSTYESGYGGRATTGVSITDPMGVAVALTGTQNPGTTTPSGDGADGKTSFGDYGGAGGGGGGGARLSGSSGGAGGSGRGGAIRIVYPGDTRQFPYDAE